MIVCLNSFILSFVFYVILRNILFFTGINISKGELMAVMRILLVFDVIVLFSIPFLMMLTGGVCN